MIRHAHPVREQEDPWALAKGVGWGLLFSTPLFILLWILFR